VSIPASAAPVRSDDTRAPGGRFRRRTDARRETAAAVAAYHET
jgi:hypothetical protein